MALEEVVKELAIPTTAADEMVGGGRREDGGGGVELDESIRFVLDGEG